MYIQVIYISLEFQCTFCRRVEEFNKPGKAYMYLHVNLKTRDASMHPSPSTPSNNLKFYILRDLHVFLHSGQKFRAP